MISVIIPTFNRADFLSRSILSVVRQTFSPAELIIVDDGSTDGTAQIVQNIAGESPVPIQYRYQKNSGAAAARNTGIRSSKCEYVAFLDSDDWWLPGKLQKQYQSMVSHPHYQISHTREIWYRNDKRVNQKKKHDPPHGDIFEASLRMCMVGMSTVMAKKTCFDTYGFFDEQLLCCEDYDLWLRMSCQLPFLRVDTPLICKDGGRDDQLSVIHRMGMDTFRIQALCNLLEGSSLSEKQRSLSLIELQRKCTIYGNGCIKHGRQQEGQRYLELPNKYLSNGEQKA